MAINLSLFSIDLGSNFPILVFCVRGVSVPVAGYNLDKRIKPANKQPAKERESIPITRSSGRIHCILSTTKPFEPSDLQSKRQPCCQQLWNGQIQLHLIPKDIQIQFWEHTSQDQYSQQILNHQNGSCRSG